MNIFSLKSAKGASLITIIIVLAFTIALFNLYAYFNPGFQLDRFSISYQVRAFRDRQRVEDLKKIQSALERYYEENGEYPAFDGWCGRILSVLYPEVKDAISKYFPNEAIPQDPALSGSESDYFYIRESRDVYALLAVMENLPKDAKKYNYKNCYHWPGDDIFNYQIKVSR